MFRTLRRLLDRVIVPLAALVVLMTSAPDARTAPFAAATRIDDRSDFFTRWNAAHADAYALDGVERFIEWSGRGKPRVACARGAMVAYSGTSMRYAGPVLVDPAFRDRLSRFEEVVRDVAISVYGRAPRVVRHYGAFSCRTSRRRPGRVSEHALGNAIDVVGFDFAAARRVDALPEELPRSLKAPFQVRVSRHWSANATETGRIHERFLHELTARLEGRPDIFRILVGPGHGNHSDHFHFDASPWRFVDL
jgi:hypothetical protein